MPINRQKSLDEIRDLTIKVLEPHIQDKALLKLIVTSSLTDAVIETKRICEGAIIGCEKKMGDNVSILDAVELAVPTSDISTKLLT